MPSHNPKLTPAAVKMKKCSRGHKFMKNSDYPVCPICWPGYYKKDSK